MSERAVWSARLESRLAEERRGRAEKLRVAGRRGPGEWRSAVREPRLVRRGGRAPYITACVGPRLKQATVPRTPPD